MKARVSTVRVPQADSRGRLGFGARSSATTQRRNRFAFSLFAKATAAIDTPGLRQAATTFALNSALCLRRRRRVMPSSEVFTCPPRI